MTSAYSFFVALSVILVTLTLRFDLNIFGWKREMMAGYGFLI
jgi:hypothetical protein